MGQKEGMSLVSRQSSCGQRTWALNVYEAWFRLLHETFKLVLLPLGLERGVKQISSERLANRTIRGSKSQQMKTDAPLLMFLASVFNRQVLLFSLLFSRAHEQWESSVDMCKQGLSVGASISVSAEATGDSTSLLYGTKKSSSLVNVDWRTLSSQLTRVML